MEENIKERERWKRVINLEDLTTIFSPEEIEARKRKIIEESEQLRLENHNAKELERLSREELRAKGWDASIIRPDRKPDPIPEKPKEPTAEEALEELTAITDQIKAEAEQEAVEGWSTDEHIKEDLKAVEEILKRPDFTEAEIEQTEAEIIEEVKEQVNNKAQELHPGDQQCPECKGWFRRGGAFSNHYNSHFSGE